MGFSDLAVKLLLPAMDLRHGRGVADLDHAPRFSRRAHRAARFPEFGRILFVNSRTNFRSVLAAIPVFGRELRGSSPRGLM
jgi:hypothetical protein